MKKIDIPERYKPSDIEASWQKKWEETGIYIPDMKNARKPYYNLMMFPYPSAEGLHVGNMYAFTGVDIHGRYMRMRGYDVFEPIGLDGFGIHSENYALKVNRHPKEQAKISQANFYRQLRAIGNSFDWTRTLETYDPDYYRWTQWLFVQMFTHGLAYRAKAQVNWCPSDKTVLADEQVIDGKCERCSSFVEKKELEQWFFKITAYAERLLQNTYKSSFNWTENVKLGQRHWIGKKDGINISYQVILGSAATPGSVQVSDSGQARLSDATRMTAQKHPITCFTTTPVNFGATFLVLAPEHPEVKKITTSKQKNAVNKYIDMVGQMKKEDRIAQGKEKTGVFTGAYAINHVTKESIPIWISDFVLVDVGTGAIQGCPGHDLRDFEFAKKFGIPIKRVVVGPDGDTSPIEKPEQVIESGMPGKMINSQFLNGIEFKEAMEKTKDYFVEKGWGKRVITYHLRDWLISRQRYWGAPIPMIYCKKCASDGKSWFTTNSPQPSLTKGGKVPPLYKRGLGGVSDQMPGWYPVPEDELPIELPDVVDWRPTGSGRGPLAGHPEFYKTTCPHCGGPAERETDVCDTFLDSSWYYLRYPFVTQKQTFADKNLFDPQLDRGKPQVDLKGLVPPRMRSAQILSASVKGDNLPWTNEITNKWFPIDSYIGGAEHTVLHLLYTRFVWMALGDWGFLEVKKPKKDEFNPEEPFKRFFAHGLIIKDGAKMSKSKGNVVVPDQYIKLYGADTLRTYLMFLGPFDSGGDFRDSGISGMYRWLSRVWRLVQNFAKKDSLKINLDTSDGPKIMAKTIKKVTSDLDRLQYNTAIASLMEFTNWWMDHEGDLNIELVVNFLKLLAPFAPYMTEELFQKLTAHSSQLSAEFESIHIQPWPIFDPELIKEDKVSFVVQINGKVRDVLEMTVQVANAQPSVEHTVRSSAKAQKWLANKPIKKTIFIPQKLINFVV